MIPCSISNAILRQSVLVWLQVWVHSSLQEEQATEIQIAADHILKTRQKLNQILAENTGQPLEVINADTERDNFMTAEEAKAYGLIDEVIKNR